jgi:predicted 2-oxoglutarate/Fe(II)-dependent dioxygenase YbiX
MKELKKPIIVDDFLDIQSLKMIQKQISKTKKHALSGSVRSTYDYPVIHERQKKNKVGYLNEESNQLILLEIKNKILNSLKNQNILLPKEFLLGSPQISIYREGDYYAPHSDRTDLGITFLMFISERTFTGGHIRFHKKKQVETIRYKTNRAIIFGSKNIHEVSKVKGNGVRISLQFFLSMPNGFLSSKKIIVQKRQELAQVFFNLSQPEIDSPEDIYLWKKTIMNFKEVSFEGAYRYIYEKVFHKTPRNISSELRLLPHISLAVGSRNDLLMRVICKNKKIWTEVVFKEKTKRYHFDLIALDIAQDLEKNLSRMKLRKTR